MGAGGEPSRRTPPLRVRRGARLKAPNDGGGGGPKQRTLVPTLMTVSNLEGMVAVALTGEAPRARVDPERSAPTQPAPPPRAVVSTGARTVCAQAGPGQETSSGFSKLDGAASQNRGERGA